jgi:hypothetical protein
MCYYIYIIESWRREVDTEVFEAIYFHQLYVAIEELHYPKSKLLPIIDRILAGTLDKPTDILLRHVYFPLRALIKLEYPKDLLLDEIIKHIDHIELGGTTEDYGSLSELMFPEDSFDSDSVTDSIVYDIKMRKAFADLEAYEQAERDKSSVKHIAR